MRQKLALSPYVSHEVKIRHDSRKLKYFAEHIPILPGSLKGETLPETLQRKSSNTFEILLQNAFLIF